MHTEFVKATFDIDCDWNVPHPVYRIFVNDELFAERTWIWEDSYLNEMLQIAAPPGQYRIRLESVNPAQSNFRISNHAVEHGPARWIDHEYLEITNASK